MQDDAPLIRIESLVNRFGPHTVHDGLDLDIFRGEILGLVGGSGSGKSVLVRSLLGLNRPQAGHIWFEDVDILRLPYRELQALQRCWGMLFQGGALFSGLTVLENIETPMREVLRLPAAIRCELAELRLRLVGLPVEAGDRFPAELSGGMVKRAALARALALEPEVLILDEPTAGLDPLSATAFDELIHQLREALGLTVIIVTHDLQTLVGLCDRIAVLLEGRAVAGTLKTLSRAQHPWLRSYFHGARMQAIRPPESDHGT